MTDRRFDIGDEANLIAGKIILEMARFGDWRDVEDAIGPLAELVVEKFGGANWLKSVSDGGLEFRAQLRDCARAVLLAGVSQEGDLLPHQLQCKKELQEIKAEQEAQG